MALFLSSSSSLHDHVDGGADSQKQRLKWCVELLLLRNADVTLVQQPEPVVMCAVKSEDTAIVRLVVAKGADCDSQLSPDVSNREGPVGTYGVHNPKATTTLMEDLHCYN